MILIRLLVIMVSLIILADVFGMWGDFWTNKLGNDWMEATISLDFTMPLALQSKRLKWTVAPSVWIFNQRMWTEYLAMSDQHVPQPQRQIGREGPSTNRLLNLASQVWGWLRVHLILLKNHKSNLTVGQKKYETLVC